MIRNIVFDIGDVLLEYRWKDMLVDYGLSVESAKEVGNLMFTDPLWRELDYANRSREDIIGDYKRKYPQHQEVMEWFILHGEYMHVSRKEVWEKVHELKEKGYGIYLLSNYSEDLFLKHTKGASFIDDADGVVVSYQIHRAKPEPEIYNHLFQKYHLSPEECIFFDDREENTKAARKLGMQAITVESKEQLLQELEKF